MTENPQSASATRFPEWVAGATLTFALLTWKNYFASSFAPGLVAFLELAVVFLITTSCGRMAVRFLGFSNISDSEKTLIGATLGLGFLSLGGWTLALFHILNKPVLVLSLAGLWVIGWTEMRAVAGSLSANRNLLGREPLLAASIFFFLALVFWMTLAPPHQYDSLVYHLPLAEAYARSHRLVAPLPLVYSYFPHNGEMLFAEALLMGSDLLAQMFMWISLALSLWWVFEMGKREAPLPAVLLGCLLLATHTSVMLLSSTTYVEPLVMLWTTAAVFSFLRWHEEEQKGWLVLSAIFTGLALGTKYYAGITAGLLGIWLAARAHFGREKGLAAHLDIFLYAGIVIAIFLPWMAKNVYFVGNPLFPFLYSIFPSTGHGWNEEVARKYFGVLTEYSMRMGYLGKNFLMLPLMLLADSARFGGGMDVLGGVGWGFVFWGLPIAGWWAPRNRFLKTLFLFCAAYLVVWVVTGVVIRYLTVLVPLLSLLSGCGFYGLWGKLGRPGRAVLASAVAVAIATNFLLFFFIHFAVFQEAGVVLGAESRREFLSRRLDYYPCALFAAERLGENDKILVFGEQRGYYIKQEHLITAVLGPTPFAVWANDSPSPEALAQRMNAEGFGYMLYVPREFKRLGGAAGWFTERGNTNWTGLEGRFALPVFRATGCWLYKLKAS